MKYLQRFILIFSVLVIIFGFVQLNYKNDIFANSKAHCCNDGLCNYYFEDPVLCTTLADAYLKPCCNGIFCTEYTMTCKKCVEKSEQGLVCKDPKSSCEDQFGNCYGWCLVNGKWQWNLTQK